MADAANVADAAANAADVAIVADMGNVVNAANVADTTPVADATTAADGMDAAMGEMRRRVLARALEDGTRPSACVLTFGCQMNDYDSEKISGIVEKMGYALTRPGAWIGGRVGRGMAPVEGKTLAESDALPSLVIINTCCVRESAEQRIFGILGACKRLKGASPGSVVAVCGCMAHEASAVEKILAHYPFVDFLFGTDSLQRLPELLLAATSGGCGPLRVQGEPRGVAESMPFSRKPPPLARVSVMHGCDNCCAYCVVPMARGHERSRRVGDIMREVEGLAASGYREVMLLGQNVNAYGNDLPAPEADFADLLRLVAAVPGILRVRFMTSHPKDLSGKLIDAVAQTPEVEKHVHLPVQSGSDSVLACMNRRYTSEGYAALAERIRARVPGASITTDIIVGFPGETEQDFLDTLALVSRVRFDAAYTFIYSPREGTPAAGFGGQVDRDVACERFSRLLALQNGISLEINRELVGRRVEVLCEGASKTDPGRLTGRTIEGKIVNFAAGDGDGAGGGGADGGSEGLAAPGRLALVEIDNAHTWSLSGRMVDCLG